MRRWPAQALAKVLLYLRLVDGERQGVAERTELAAKLRAFGKLNARRQELAAGAFSVVAGRGRAGDVGAPDAGQGGGGVRVGAIGEVRGPCAGARSPALFYAPAHSRTRPPFPPKIAFCGPFWRFSWGKLGERVIPELVTALISRS